MARLFRSTVTAGVLIAILSGPVAAGNVPTTTNKPINKLSCKELDKLLDRLARRNLELTTDQLALTGMLNSAELEMRDVNAYIIEKDAQIKRETDASKIKALKRERKAEARLGKDVARDIRKNTKAMQKIERELAAVSSDEARARKARRANGC